MGIRVGESGRGPMGADGSADIMADSWPNDLDVVLTAMVDDARMLMDADIAALSLLEEDGTEIAMRAVSGNRTDAYRRVRLRPGEGIAGQIVETGRPVVLNSFLDEAQITPENYPIFAEEGIRAAVGVPLKLGGQMAGALAVGSRADATYTERELLLLSNMAAQAALAIETAKSAEELQSSTVAVAKMSHLVSGQFRQIRRLLIANTRLASMVLQGQSVKSIAETLALVLECSVAVGDRLYRVVTSHTREGLTDDFWRRLVGGRSLLPDDSPASLYLRTQMETSERERRPISLSPQGVIGIEWPMIVAPIIAGQDSLGFVLVGQGARSLGDVDLMVVEHAATVFALKMMAERISVEVEARLKGEFLDELLMGTWRDAESTRQRAAYLGHDLSQPYGLLVIQVDDLILSPKDFRWQQRRAVALQRSVEETARAAVQRRWPQSMVTSKGDGVVVIAAIRHDDGTGEVVSSAEDFAFALQHRLRDALKEASVSIGLGRMCQSLDEYPKAYREACYGLDLAHAFGLRDQVILLHHLGSDRLLLNVEDRRELLDFVHATLGPIQEYDAKHGTHLLKTLDAYMRNECNGKAAASMLFVHPNTLRYRLKRLEQICGVSLASPAQLLDLQLALKILHVAGFQWPPTPQAPTPPPCANPQAC